MQRVLWGPPVLVWKLVDVVGDNNMFTCHDVTFTMIVVSKDIY